MNSLNHGRFFYRGYYVFGTSMQRNRGFGLTGRFLFLKDRNILTKTETIRHAEPEDEDEQEVDPRMRIVKKKT